MTDATPARDAIRSGSAMGDGHDEAMKQYYAARAREYERIYDKPERQPELARLRAELPPRFRGRRVLEIACGTGYWTQFIAATAADVLATDANAEVIEIAARKPLPAGRVRFRLADAYEPPRETPPRDAALAAFWWSHVAIADRPRFLAGLAACLAPGAVVVMLDNRFVPGSSTPIAEIDAAGDTWQHRVLGDGTRHRVLKNFPGADQLAHDLATIGERVEVRTLEYYWVAACIVRDRPGTAQRGPSPS